MLKLIGGKRNEITSSLAADVRDEPNITKTVSCAEEEFDSRI